MYLYLKMERHKTAQGTLINLQKDQNYCYLLKRTNAKYLPLSFPNMNTTWERAQAQE